MISSPREQVLSVLAGETPHCVPFIIWDNKLPSPEIEARLLDLGACIVVKSTVRIRAMLAREGWVVSRKQVQRLRRREDLGDM